MAGGAVVIALVTVICPTLAVRVAMPVTVTVTVTVIEITMV